MHRVAFILAKRLVFVTSTGYGVRNYAARRLFPHGGMWIAVNIELMRSSVNLSLRGDDRGHLAAAGGEHRNRR